MIPLVNADFAHHGLHKFLVDPLLRVDRDRPSELGLLPRRGRFSRSGGQVATTARLVADDTAWAQASRGLVIDDIHDFVLLRGGPRTTWVISYGVR